MLVVGRDNAMNVMTIHSFDEVLCDGIDRGMKHVSVDCSKRALATRGGESFFTPRMINESAMLRGWLTHLSQKRAGEHCSLSLLEVFVTNRNHRSRKNQKNEYIPQVR